MKGKFLVALGVAGVLALSACTTSVTKSTSAPAPRQASQEEKTHDATRLAMMADGLVGRVVGSMGPGAVTGLVAIATPVDVSSLEQTDWLGRELAEQFVNALHKRGFPVYEYKLKGWLEVTKEGDYIYSRNWQKLASKANVSRVLSGTLSRNDTGVMLYARLVNLKTQVVEGSSELFIPYEVLPKCYRAGASTCNLAGLSPLYPVAPNLVATNSSLNKQPAVKSEKKSFKRVTANKASNTKKGTYATKTKARTKKLNKQGLTNRDAPVVTNEPDNQVIAYKVPPVKNNSTSYTGEGACTACAQGSGTVSKCHKDCYEAVTYPASTMGVGGLLVRDASGQSQYDRK